MSDAEKCPNCELPTIDLTEPELRGLLEYSASTPTGQVTGKTWKCKSRCHQGNYWIHRGYAAADDPKRILILNRCVRIVTPADLRQQLSEAKYASRTRRDYDLRYDQCGAPHWLDTSLPSEVWNTIAAPGETLCMVCIDERLAAAGLTAEAEFSFSGKALTSKMYAESHGEVQALERQIAEQRRQLSELQMENSQNAKWATERGSAVIALQRQLENRGRELDRLRTLLLDGATDPEGLRAKLAAYNFHDDYIAGEMHPQPDTDHGLLVAIHNRVENLTRLAETALQSLAEHRPLVVKIVGYDQTVQFPGKSSQHPDDGKEPPA